jgi:argininosuccinate synthase
MNLVSLLGHRTRASRLRFGRYAGLAQLDHGTGVFEIREIPAAWLILRTGRHLEGGCLPADCQPVCALAAAQAGARSDFAAE